MLQHGPLLADVSAFMKSRVILTACELDLFSHLHERSSTPPELALRIPCDLEALSRILDVLAAYHLLAKEGDKYTATGQGELLSARHPESVLPMVLHMGRLWDNWSGLTQTVRKGRKKRPSKAHRMDEPSRKAFIGAMHVVAKDLSDEIAGSYDGRPFTRLLDVGGASGTYTIAFLKKNPHLFAVLFDLKEVAPMAETRLKDEGLADRAIVVAGDFYRDELPQGCDLALLSAIIHQNSPRQNLALYRKIHRALEPGGAILVRDHIMDPSRTKPAPGTLFAINMLVGTRGGDTYTFEEVKDALQEAGFTGVRLIRSGERMDCLVEARKKH